MPHTEIREDSSTAVEAPSPQTAAAGELPLESEWRPGPRRLARYLFWLLSPAAFLYVLPLLLVRVPSFERWGGSTYGPALDYGFRTAGQNADVVIFGDSSALHDINPAMVSRELGVKVLNLPNSAGSLPVTDDLVLGRYLASNRPPRLIVLFFAPWELDYRAQNYRLIFEGEEMLARYGSASEIWAFVRRHPSLALQFPIQLYSVAPRAALLPLLRHQDRVAAVKATMGHMDAQARRHLEAPCQLPAGLVADSKFDSVLALAAKYRSPETRVMIYLAPIPACTNAQNVVDRPYAELSAAPPREMSPEQFLDDRNFAHLDPRAVPVATEAFADALRAALADGAGASGPHASGPRAQAGH
jgi:hypothetical protein